MAATASSMKKVLVVGLLQNDEDHSMEKMAKGFADLVRLRPGVPTLMNVRSIEELKQLPRKTAGMFSEVMFAGHSRFYGGSSEAPLRLEDRRLGGLPIRDVVDFSWHCIKTHKVNEISFWCCEVATRRGVHVGSDDGGELSMPMYQGHMLNIHRRIKKNDYAKVSSLEYMAREIAKLCISNGINKPIIMRGLNGVGYIEQQIGGGLDVKTIDYVNFNLIQRLNKAEQFSRGTVKDKEKIKECEEAVQKAIAQKKSPHIICFELNPDAYRKSIKRVDGGTVEDDEVLE